MRKCWLSLSTAIFITACSAPETATHPNSFNALVTVYAADKIYTGNPAEPVIAAIAVDAAGKIVATYKTFPLPENQHPRSPTGPAPTTIFNGVMFPGFVDGHAHLSGIGARELTINLAGTASIDEMVTRLESIAAEKPAGEVIYGRGWIETDWPEGRMPIAADLDAAAPDHPVIFVRADGHALVANTAAMAAAGITKETPNPDGGAIERDDQGAATGIFIDNAMGTILAQIQSPGEAEMREALQTGAGVYASRGWTGLHNMSVTPREAPLMAELDAANKLPQRVHNNYNASGLELAAKREFETDTIQNRAVKIYMDGALGSRGALLFAPYSDRPETSGLALRTQDETLTLLQAAYDQNVQIAVHAIGDKANSDALDWMSQITGASPAPRWRIEHAQILAPDDIARFGQTGIIASMQPSHAIGDLKFAPDRLGLDRLVGAYAWKGVLNTGGRVVGGSDAPVEVGSPLIEFYAAVARKTPQGESGPGWHPEQALSREEALALFTSAPAFASFQEDVLGTLEVGKIADLSVFDRDLMTVPEAEILEAKANATVIAGEIVWQRQD